MKLSIIYHSESGNTKEVANIIKKGANVALKTMIGHLLVKGMVVYSAGAGEGKPFTHFGAVCIQSGNEEQRERAKIFGKRIAKKTLELFS